MNNERVGVLGLGYVGLPVALAFAKRYQTVGFDINERKVRQLQDGIDVTGEVSKGELTSSTLKMTSRLEDLEGCTFFVVAVPTPTDKNNRPDLGPVIRASESVGRVLSRGAVVVYESTVYPGVTEEVCGPLLAQVSGLRSSTDFKLGYSPERINPGDKEHTFSRIVKVVSAEDAESLDRVADAYGSIVEAGIFRAASIKAAEFAKALENTQRDLNIALMNETALICDRLGIRTADVLEAAATKWNFLKFAPGLVGGHCIGVDPYYLTAKAEELGYLPQVILSGRRINDSMGEFIAQRLVKLLVQAGTLVKGARVGILGLTFKENVSDLRNSRVPDIIEELRSFGIEPLVHDPVADSAEAQHEYGLQLAQMSEFENLDAVVLAVAHDAYRTSAEVFKMLKPEGVFIDVKSLFRPSDVPQGIRYWSL